MKPLNSKVFKKRNEKTALSVSRHHMGHYKVIADMCMAGCPMVAEILVTMMNTSLLTSQPLNRWKHSALIMIENGKRQCVENPQII